jgi:hypothetical protein
MTYLHLDGFDLTVMVKEDASGSFTLSTEANHEAGDSRWSRCQLARSEPLARIERSRHSLIERRL